MSGNGRGGGNRRRSFRRRDRDSENLRDRGASASPRQGRKGAEAQREPVRDSRDNSRVERNRGGFFERPRWSPPRMSTEPIPSPDCPYCGKPILDMAIALNDRDSGEPVHFDCVIARLGEAEGLEKGDMVAYIGGGRFGVVYFGSPQDSRNFKIKKVLEWENKDDRALWRQDISDHYSLT